MTRYFYPASRAHHAYSMSIDHGMKFVNTKGGIWKPEALLHLTNPDYLIDVAGESLGLLEPQARDKVSYSFGVGPHAGEAWDEVKGVIQPNDQGYPYVGNGEPYVLLDGGDQFPLSRLINIFQRDGRGFHWPERAAA